jgi:chromosome segregation ATPase
MRCYAAVTALSVLLATPALADPPAPAADDVAMELAKLNTTLREIVGLLRKQQESDELALLVKRVELSEARLAERERALKAAQSERRALDSERGHLEMRLEMLAAEVDRRGSEIPTAEVETMTKRIEADLRRLRQRSNEVANEVAGLENAVASQSAEVQAWQAALDRRLGDH